VARLTSETSDSLSVVIGVNVGLCDGTFAVGATAAEAPPAIASDIPAAPHAGKATFERFRFAGCLARAINAVLPAFSKHMIPRRSSRLGANTLACDWFLA